MLIFIRDCRRWLEPASSPRFVLPSTVPRPVTDLMPIRFRLSTEQTLGGLEAFTPYIQSYVATFAGQAITTQQWLDHLYAFWRDAGGEDAVKKLDGVDFDAWLHGEALDIPVDVKYDTSLVDQVRSRDRDSGQRA
jgi:hypothetical protein